MGIIIIKHLFLLYISSEFIRLAPNVLENWSELGSSNFGINKVKNFVSSLGTLIMRFSLEKSVSIRLNKRCYDDLSQS